MSNDQKRVHTLRYWLTMCLWLVAFALSAQKNEVVIYGKLQDDTTHQKLINVNIAVFQDGQSFKDFSSGLGGKYEIQLPMGHVYEVKFIHPEYASKVILIDTRNIPEEERRNEFRVEAHGELFKIPAGFNQDLLRDAMTKMAFNGGSKLISPDESYADRRLTEIEVELERLRAIERDPLGMEKKFNECLAQGDSAMGAESYKDALDRYAAALRIFPKKEPAPAKYAAAKKKIQELEKQAKCDQDYEAKIAAGEAFFDQKNWNEALKAFEAAKSLKPKEVYPKEMIYAVQNAAKSYSKRTEYDRLIAKANNNFKNFQWESAITNYEAALKLFPEENFPQSQLAECRARLADKKAQPEPVKPEPVKPEPVKPEPVKPEPVKPEPVKPEPVKPEPIKPEPVKPEPEPVKPEPEPVKPEPVKPEPEPVMPEPEPAPTVPDPEPIQPEPEPVLPIIEEPVSPPVDTVSTPPPPIELPVVEPAPVDTLPEPVVETPSILEGATADTADEPLADIIDYYLHPNQPSKQTPVVNEYLLARYKAVQQQQADDAEFHRGMRSRYKKYSGKKDFKQGPTQPRVKRSYPKASQPKPQVDTSKQLIDTKTYKLGNKEITQMTYQAKDKVIVYKKVIQQGGNYYSKDQRAITPEMWEAETGTSRY
jgi:tetratricopeptide (TPR) repeat protein